jgi:hypothetical protein
MKRLLQERWKVLNRMAPDRGEVPGVDWKKGINLSIIQYRSESKPKMRREQRGP